MKIENIRLEQSLDWNQLCATIIWEDNDHPPFEMKFAVPTWADVTPDVVAEPFVLACVTRAMDRCERRIHCDLPVVAGWLEGVRSALSVLNFWGREVLPHRQIPNFEIPLRAALETPGRSAAGFYSGGIDSSHLLLHYGKGSAHGLQLSHALMVYGLDMGKRPDSRQESVFGNLLSAAKPFLTEQGILPLPIYTNLRHLDERLRFFLELSAGLDLAALALLFPSRFSAVMQATAGEPLLESVQVPMSLNPIVPYLLQSPEVRLVSPFLELSRFGRVHEVVQSSTAMAALRVCFFSDEKKGNCGVCEKCVRTMLIMHACGQAVEPVFGRSLQSAGIRSIRITSSAIAFFYEDILRELGTSPFASDVAFLLHRWRLRKIFIDIETRLRRLARAVLPSILRAGLRRLRG